MTVAEWRAVVGYEGLYEVSNEGRVRSLDRLVHYKDGHHALRRGAEFTRTRRHRRHREDYFVVTLRKDDVSTQFLVHRLVLEAFAGPCPNGMETRHLDGNTANNSTENLAWGTRQENADDRHRHGTSTQGSKHGTAKLTEADVIEIRAKIGLAPVKELARVFGVSDETIRRIVKGETWTHI